MNAVMKISCLSLLLIFNTVNAENIRIPIKSGSNGAVTFDTNISNDGTEHQMNSFSSGFSSTNGHRANATVNIKKGDGAINYTHKNLNRTISVDTNISSDETGHQVKSVGGGFSGWNGHGVSATVNLIGSGGTINYTHTNNRTKFKFSSRVSINNGNHGANIGVQIPFGTK